MMIGMFDVPGSAFRTVATWYPSMSGIMTSSRIRSGGLSATDSSASAPVATLIVA